MPELNGLTDVLEEAKTLRSRLLYSVERALPEEEKQEFGRNDFRWSETKLGEDSPTGRPMVYINTRKFLKKGAPKSFENDVLLSESLHNLKNVAPTEYQKLYNSAISDPEYKKWANESYEYSKQNLGETRNFEDWHKQSRFDQVLMGYLFANNPNMPSMKDWSREDLPYGKEFKKQLEKLRKELLIE